MNRIVQGVTDHFMGTHMERSIQSVTIQLTHTASHLVVSIGINNAKEHNNARKQRKTSA